MGFRKGIFPVAVVVILLGLLISTLLSFPSAVALASEPVVASDDPFLQPAPTQPIGYFDHFGELLTPEIARKRVIAAGLNPDDPDSFARIGAVEITEDFVAQGREIFFDRGVGDMFGLQQA